MGQKTNYFTILGKRACLRTMTKYTDKLAPFKGRKKICNEMKCATLISELFNTAACPIITISRKV